MGDSAQPVLSPSLLQGHGPPGDPGMLAALPLLHDSTATTSGDNWAAWFAHVGPPDVACNLGPHFSTAVLAIEAAEAGLDVTLARTSLVGEDLASGRLVAPFPPPVPTTFSYWLVSLPETAATPRIAALRTWLLEEAHPAAAE